MLVIATKEYDYNIETEKIYWGKYNCRMNDLLSNNLIIIFLAIIVGWLVGYFLIKPIFSLIGKFVSRKSEKVGILFHKLAKLSSLIGVILVLNIVPKISFFNISESSVNKVISVFTIIGFTHISVYIYMIGYENKEWI